MKKIVILILMIFLAKLIFAQENYDHKLWISPGINASIGAKPLREGAFLPGFSAEVTMPLDRISISANYALYYRIAIWSDWEPVSSAHLTANFHLINNRNFILSGGTGIATVFPDAGKDHIYRTSLSIPLSAKAIVWFDKNIGLGTEAYMIINPYMNIYGLRLGMLFGI